MIVIFASGSGSNFEAIANAFPNKLAALVCDVENAYVIERAKKFNIPVFVVPNKKYSTRAAHEKEMINTISHLTNIKLFVFAGYMRILSPYFFAELKNKNINVPLINLHPAHLDTYKGAHAYKFAIEHKFPRFGLSVHKVVEEIDSGKLINTVEFPIYPYENEHELRLRVRPLEHKLIIESIQKILS